MGLVYEVVKLDPSGKTVGYVRIGNDRYTSDHSKALARAGQLTDACIDEDGNWKCKDIGGYEVVATQVADLPRRRNARR